MDGDVSVLTICMYCVLLRAAHLGVQTHDLNSGRAGVATAVKTQELRDVVPEWTIVLMVVLKASQGLRRLCWRALGILAHKLHWDCDELNLVSI